MAAGRGTEGQGTEEKKASKEGSTSEAKVYSSGSVMCQTYTCLEPETLEALVDQRSRSTVECPVP
jgi:hypothetical protein